MFRRSAIRLIELLVAKDLFWWVFRPLVSIAEVLKIKRVKAERKKTIQHLPIYTKINELTVLQGPFKGMKYPSQQSVGGLSNAKIAGTYELELAPLIEEIKQTSYNVIVDVGCAEGYYAVGLAMHKPETTIYAYDIDHTARRLCNAMITANNTSNVQVRTFCTPESLAAIDFGTKGLVISDCEGYEKKLFNVESVNNLRNCDVLIETHDFMDIEITSYLMDLFAETHHISTIYSIDDIHKAKTYTIPHAKDLTIEQKLAIVAEGRPVIMEWLWCKPKL